MKMFRTLSIMAIGTMAAGTAYGFGTIHGLGQDAEHERITRRAFVCAKGAAAGDCFQPKTLNMLAGAPGDFGAVGAPDRGALIFKSDAHCDGGDYFNVPGYPQSKVDARSKLEACRTWMLAKLDEAVTDAGELLDAKGQLRDSEMPTIVQCRFGGRVKRRAKCNVLEDFGILLHASEDFYSHSNWTDAHDSTRPLGPENPPGLNKRGPAPWLDLRTEKPFPDGLISGCFETKSAISEVANCNYGPNNASLRVKHLALNKDKGRIDPKLGAGTTERGRVNDNFAHAVEAAIADSKDKWETLKEQLILTYGPSRGSKMICAITHDHPMKSC